MSNDEKAFLDAIVADPDEDTHRLVYADWYTENNQEEKGEFIRVQIALAKCSPPHKQTEYPDVVTATAMTCHGDKHYSFTGYPENKYAIGDRVDILVHRPLKKPKKVYGFRVYKIEPMEVYEAGSELEIYVRLDADSRPWIGTDLAVRERDLLKANYKTWLTCGGCPTGGLTEDNTTFRRGFLHAITCTMADVLERYQNGYDDASDRYRREGWRVTDRAKAWLRAHPTVQEVWLTDTSSILQARSLGIERNVVNVIRKSL